MFINHWLKQSSTKDSDKQYKPRASRHRRLSIELLEQRCMLAGLDAQWMGVASDPDPTRTLFNTGQPDDAVLQELNYLNATVVSLFGLPTIEGLITNPGQLTLVGGTSPSNAAASSAAPLAELTDFDSGSVDGEANQEYTPTGGSDPTIVLQLNGAPAATGRLIDLAIDTDAQGNSRGDAIVQFTEFPNGSFAEIGTGPVYVILGDLIEDGGFPGFPDFDPVIPETIAAKFNFNGRSEVTIYESFDGITSNDFQVGNTGTWQWPSHWTIGRSGSDGIAELYRQDFHLDNYAWMIDPAPSGLTGRIDFAPGAAGEVEFYIRPENEGTGNFQIVAYDDLNNPFFVQNYDASNFSVSDPFEEVGITGNIRRIDFYNQSDVIWSIDDCGYIWEADFGDAPDTMPGTSPGNYNTFAGDFGPAHAIIPTLKMGPTEDGEFDGQPHPAALGDDLLDGFDDEDGLVNPKGDLSLTLGVSPTVDVLVTNTTGTDATLYGWIDYDGDGEFEPGEGAIAPVVVSTGAVGSLVTLTFPAVPAGFSPTTFARFRLSTDAAAATRPIGGAPDGEVEDYKTCVCRADEIGVHRGRSFYLDANDNGTWNGTLVGDRIESFGNPGDTPLVGDWDGDGYDEIGVHRGNRFYLDANGNGTWDGTAGGDLAYQFGNIGDTPIVGDWNGDCVFEIGVKRGRRFYLDANGDGTWNGTGGGDLSYGFGNPSDTPVIGDWDGNGRDDIGVHRGRTFYLDGNSNGSWNGTGGGGDLVYQFGNVGDTPIAGDWDGDWDTEIGVKRGRRFYLDANGNGTWDGTGSDLSYGFGIPSDTPVIGAWAPPPLLLAASGVARQPVAGQLTLNQLTPVVASAVDLLTNSGLTSLQLATLNAVTVDTTDLSGARLGQASGSSILIDVNAAGYGWFIDSTPHNNEEFEFVGSQGLVAAGDSAASGRMDLLTVVLHELGHVLGLSDDHSGGVMDGSLSVGIRRLA